MYCLYVLCIALMAKPFQIRTITNAPESLDDFGTATVIEHYAGSKKCNFRLVEIPENRFDQQLEVYTNNGYFSCCQDEEDIFAGIGNLFEIWG